ncbi:MAG: CinA family nicotinamide mononucleotide deamidase-related protein [Pseudomonadota bacterium]
MPHAPPLAEVEILSQGDEVLLGEVVDTNAAEIARAVTDLGVPVGRHACVGDDPDTIAALLREAAERVSEVICTGGLGPTDDDHTAEAVARAFALELFEHPRALEQIRARYARFQRELDSTGRRQARLPRGARLLENRWGTAPGFMLDRRPARLWFLPGVPAEMRAMLAAHVLPALRERYPELAPGRTVVFRCLGLGESHVQLELADIVAPGLRVGYRATLPEVQVKLRFAQDADPDAAEVVVAEVRRRLGAAVFAEEDGTPAGSIEEVVGRMLLARGETVATAESCTAGRVAAALTRMSGSSAWLLEGAVVYSNAAKERAAGVPHAMLEAHGAVSEPVARALAEGIRARAGTTWGLATTGIAGPTGGSPEKPVGTVHIAVAGPEGTAHRALRLPGDREQVMARTVASVLALLREVMRGG